MFERLILGLENQAAAGRWRAMTRAQFTAENDHDVVKKYLLENLAFTLVIAGCGQSDAHTQMFFAHLQERLSTIVNHVLRLRNAIGKDITSMDLKPFTVPPQSAFVFDTMEDTYGEARKVGGAGRSPHVSEKVAGTTEFGVRKCVKGTKGIEESILLKAKVIFCSALY